MKIVKSFVEPCMLLISVIKAIENAGKEQNGGFCGMSLVTLVASSLRNMVNGKSVIHAAECIGAMHAATART